MMRPLTLALFALLFGVVPPIAGAATNSVAGTVTYKHRMALPADAIVHVTLQDTSRADTAARDIGQADIPIVGAQGPIPWRIEYDPATIDPSHSYTVRATITAGDRLLFTSTKVHPVLTLGAGNEAAIDVYMILPGNTAPPAQNPK